MSEFGVLQCPMCENLRLCPVDQFDTPAELKELASAHLQSHRLTESKQGIFRVMMVRELRRIEVDEPANVPRDRWTDDTESLPV